MQFFGGNGDLFLTEVYALGIDKKHDRFVCEPPLPHTVRRDTRSLHRRITFCKPKRELLACGVVHGVVYSKVKGAWTEELVGIAVGLNSLLLTRVRLVHLGPVRVIAWCHRDGKGEAVLRASRDFVVERKVRIVSKHTRILRGHIVACERAKADSKFKSIPLRKRNLVWTIEVWEENFGDRTMACSWRGKGSYCELAQEKQSGYYQDSCARSCASPVDILTVYVEANLESKGVEMTEGAIESVSSSLFSARHFLSFKVLEQI